MSKDLHCHLLQKVVKETLDKMYFLVSLSWPKIIQISHFLVPKMSNFDDTLLGKANQVPKDH